MFSSGPGAVAELVEQPSYKKKAAPLLRVGGLQGVAATSASEPCSRVPCVLRMLCRNQCLKSPAKCPFFIRVKAFLDGTR